MIDDHIYIDSPVDDRRPNSLGHSKTRETVINCILGRDKLLIEVNTCPVTTPLGCDSRHRSLIAPALIVSTYDHNLALYLVHYR
jgi:hypothetical protein